MNIYIRIIIFICVATPTTSLMIDCSARRNDFNTSYSSVINFTDSGSFRSRPFWFKVTESLTNKSSGNTINSLNYQLRGSISALLAVWKICTYGILSKKTRNFLN